MESSGAHSLKPHEFSGGVYLCGPTATGEDEFVRVSFRTGDRFVIPLASHVGRASIPCVTLGQRVERFEPIALPDGPVSVAQHAPCSANVVEISATAHGGESPRIVLESDGEQDAYTLPTAFDVEDVLNNTDAQQQAEKRIAAAGIIGMGGAGFPAHLKLREGINAEVSDLIINGVECEPLARGDRYLLAHESADIIAGMRILQALLQPRRTVLAIGPEPDRQPLEKALGKTGIELLQTSAKYPSGSEKQLIQILRNEELPLNTLPIHLGVVCFNLATVQAMYRAATKGEPCVSRKLTLNGRRSVVVEAPVGMSVGMLLNKLGERVTKDTIITTAGMMMGREVSSESPITKLTHEISLRERSLQTQKESPCIRCGECISVCPVRLQPQNLYELSRLGDLDNLQEFGLFDCIECGCCTHVCPSQISLVEYFVASKREVNQLGEVAGQREWRRERYARHLARQSNATPAERHAVLAEIPGGESGDLDLEIEKLKSRLAGRKGRARDD